MDVKPVPSNFCWRPFTNLYVDKWGFRGPCCGFQQVEKFDEQYLKDLNLHQSIRNDIKKEILPKECHYKCTSLEEKGILLTDRINYYGPTDDNLVKENRFELKQIELSVDNVCNLACVTCGSQHSSRWIAENKRMEIVGDYETNTVYLDVDLFKKPHLWEKVEKLILYGGEPFYSKNSMSLINWLIENKLTQKIELSFYTNGTIIPDNILEIIESFNKIRCSFSIDATQQRFELLRWPAKWDIVDRNFKKLNVISDKNVRIDMTYTYSMLNACYSVEDFEYFVDNYNYNIGLNVVNDPSCWQARHLPNNIKEKLIKKYQNNFYAKDFIPELEADREEDKYQEAMNKLRNLDKFRNTDHRILFDEI